MKHFKKISQLYKQALQVRNRFGKPILEQLQEIWCLSKKPNSLSPSEYYDFQYAKGEFDKGALNNFIGYRAYNQYSKLNASSWHGIANDKIIFHSVMKAAGFNAPKIYAVYSSCKRSLENTEQLSTPSELHDFFKWRCNFPVIIKPIHGYYGQGVYLLRGYDANSGLLELANGQISLSALLTELSHFLNTGIIVQEKLSPSETIKEIIGDTLSSVRLIVLLTEAGPTLQGASWKIPTGSNIVDNTDGWRNGNLVACPEIDSGIITHICQGNNGSIVSGITKHPDTQAPLVGQMIPEYQKQKEFALKAASIFPGLGFQGWDIVSTTKGIMALEVNLVGSSTIYATQLVSQKGLLSDNLRYAINKC